MWAFLALAAALLASFNPILYKRMLSESTPIAVVWSIIGLGLPLLTLTTFVLTPVLPRVDGLFILATLGSATLNAAAHLSSARSLKLADASLVTPLLTFSPIFTLLISALFLGETSDARGLLGVVLVLTGAYWLNREPGASRLAPFKAVSMKPGVALVLFAGLLWAITPVLEKLAIQHTFPESPRLVALAVNGLLVGLLTPFVLRRGQSIISALPSRKREWLLASLIAGTVPNLGFTAIGLGPVGYVTTLFRLSTVFTVIWGAWLLRESGLRQRLPASMVMVTGAILISV